jgi:hypothetical protein
VLYCYPSEEIVMTKKDYELIAKTILPSVIEAGLFGASRIRMLVVEEIAYNLAYAFKQENSRFDHAKFLKACGFGKDTL